MTGQKSEMTPMSPYQFFKETFDLPFNKYLDTLMSAQTGKPMLDIFKFDEWLHEKYGNYEESGHSMLTILIEKYGQEAADRIRELVG
jgi:hypothetical protein